MNKLKFTYLSTLFISTLFLVSCTEDEIDQELSDHANNVAIISEYFGLSESQVDILDDRYKFLEDRIIPFSEMYKYEDDLKLLKTQYKDNNKRVRRYATVPQGFYRKKIKYWIITTDLDPWQTHFFTESVNWTMTYMNSKRFGIQFIPSPSRGSADMEIKLADILGNPVCDGEAQPPTSTAVGKRITMTPGNVGYLNRFIASLIHEIGHALGLAHPNDTRHIIIPGTGNDPTNSIMYPLPVGCSLGNHVPRLTDIDIFALESIYKP